MDLMRRTLPYIGLVLIAVALAIFGIKYSPGTPLSEMTVPILIGVIGALAVLLSFQVRAIGPNFRDYVSYSLTSLFVFGSLVLAYVIVKNHSFSYDATEQRMYSLHPRTIEYLRGIEQDVHITAFASPDDRREIESFLQRYTRYSPRVHYEVRNFYKENRLAKEFAESVTPGDIFVWTGTRGEPGKPKPPDYREKKMSSMELGREAGESKLTNAIVEVMRPEKIVVYFLKGHGEASLQPDFGGPERRSIEEQLNYSEIERYLREELSFEVKPLEIGRTGFVPDDCSVLICAGPQLDLLPLETEAITKYLEGGGRALLLLDPNERQGVQFAQWEKMLAHFGVKIRGDIVIEPSPLMQLLGGPTSLLVSKFGNHPTVEKLSGRSEMLQMSRARTVAPLENRPSTLAVTELMYSGPSSWSEDYEKLAASTRLPLPSRDRMKEQPLAVAVTMEAAAGRERPMRTVVVGDSDIFSDRFLQDHTLRLFVSVTNWLTAREDLIDIPTKRLSNTPIFLTATQMRTTFTVLVLAVPGAIFFGGMSYVLARRRAR
ncbi:GldG family protein [Candidatus Sumerlaeota bacterium]|nr:GldG family protein [Candidatus Sumerlaeota bacterium]